MSESAKRVMISIGVILVVMMICSSLLMFIGAGAIALGWI